MKKQNYPYLIKGTWILIMMLYIASAIAQSVTVDGRTYSLSWSDEFNSKKLDMTKWVLYGPNTMWEPGAADGVINPPFFTDSAIHFPIHYINGKWYGSGILGRDEKAGTTLKSVPVNSYIEMRVKLPLGVRSTSNPDRSGVWSGLWLMPDIDQSTTNDYYYQETPNWRYYWPSGGEIDVAETHTWWTGNTISHEITSTAIYGNIGGGDPKGFDQTARSTQASYLGLPNFEDNWHVIGFHRYQDGGTVKLSYWVDGNRIMRAAGWPDTTPTDTYVLYNDGNTEGHWPRVSWGGLHPQEGPPGSPFEVPFYLLFHSNLGGAWEGDNVVINPANDGKELQMDYVRVYYGNCTGNPVTAVSLNKASTSIQLCRTEQLIATVAPANACDQAMTWSSDNTAVATVDASGLVTAVATGTANITVKTNSGGFTKTCAVTVTEIQTAYNNVTRTIPGRIEAEDYDTGGECVAYHDTQAGNNFSGTPYRNEDVDIKVTGDSQGGGYDVGQGFNGEWLEYTLDATAGTYDIHARVGSANSGNQLVVKLDGTILGTINVPNMGNWNDKSTQTISGVNIPGGNKKILRLEIVGNGVDINWVEFINTTTGIVSNETSAGISVYPNPTSGIFTIECSGEDKNVQLSVNDVLGRTILSKQYGTNTIHDQLDLNAFPDGMYMIKLQSDGQVKTMKLIKHF